MDKALKQRMVGAVVLIALGVIFIPMLLDGGSGEDGTRSVELNIPAAPDREYRSRRLPLDESGGESADTSRGEVARESEPDAPRQDPRQESAPSEPESAVQSPDGSPGESGSGNGGQEAESGDGGEASGSATPTETRPSGAESEPEPREESSTPLGNWFVQVGSFSQEANALELRDQLREAGYTAFVETSTVEGQTKHRVKVGPEMDRGEAEEQRDEIRAQFDLQGIVVSEP